MGHYIGCAKVMAASDHVNPDQHMNHGHINQIATHKEVKQLLGKLVDNDVKFVLADGKKHHQLKVVGNGIVTISKSPSDKRALDNIKGDIRKSIRRDIDPDWKFPD